MLTKAQFIAETVKELQSQSGVDPIDFFDQAASFVDIVFPMLKPKELNKNGVIKFVEDLKKYAIAVTILYKKRFPNSDLKNESAAESILEWAESGEMEKDIERSVSDIEFQMCIGLIYNFYKKRD